MKSKKIRLAIASLGCGIAVTAAVAGDIRRSAVESRIQSIRSEISSHAADIARRDRIYDIVNGLRLNWEHLRIAVRILYATSEQIHSPAAESAKSLIIDMLNWGNEAAFGTPLPPDKYDEVSDAAQLIMVDEIRRSEKIRSPKDAATPPNEKELAKAVSLVSGMRDLHVEKYWENRKELLERQEGLRMNVAKQEQSLRRLDAIILSLQIAGLVIVLMKDFVPDEKTTPSASVRDPEWLAK